MAPGGARTALRVIVHVGQRGVTARLAATPPVVSTSAVAKAERRGAGGPRGILVTGVLWWASTVSDFLRR